MQNESLKDTYQSAGSKPQTNYQRSILALELEEVYREKAKEKEQERKTTFQKSEKSSLPTVNTAKELAKLAHVSHDTIAKVKAIQEKKPIDLFIIGHEQQNRL